MNNDFSTRGILNIRHLFTSDSESDGETIINSLRQLNNNYPTLNELIQNGGVYRKNIIKGIRYEDNDNLSTNSSSEIYGGKKNKQSQADLLHQESVDYLKNDLKLSPLEARAYKALAYRHIKEKYPDSTSLERAKIMLSTVKSENFLDEFKEKLDSTIKILESIDSEKEKKLSEESKK
jgi:hypothetical protein